MRKVMMMFSILFLSIILSGCVTIPMTDGGTLEISADGLTIIPGEDGETGDDAGTVVEGKDEIAGESTEVEKSTDGDKAEEDGSTNDGAADKGTVETEVSGEDGGDSEESEAEENADFNGEEGFGGCAVEFYLIKNRLPQGFPIPECAYIRSFELLENRTDNKRTIIAHYEDSGELSAIQETNKSFLTSAGFGILQDSISNGDSTLIGQGDGMELTITNKLNGSGSLETAIIYSETPIKQYAITNSFINLTEKGYGKCSDEYYTLLSVMSDGFPLSECASINFLQIESGDSAITSAAGYEVDQYWTEVFDSYVQYAEANGYTITNNEGLATQGELEYGNEKYNVILSVEKISMERSSVHVNISMKIG